VPLEMMDGFDAVLASMERRVAALKQILWTLTTGSGAWPDGVGNTAQRSHMFQFDPP
jgi:hypothetical protein